MHEKERKDCMTWLEIISYLAIVIGILVTIMSEPTTVVFWFMMQIAMMIGFCTSYPANWYLVKKGVKHAM